MPTQAPDVLTEVDAEAWIAQTCFSTGPTGRLGLELEFLVGNGGATQLSRHYPQDRYPALLAALSRDGLQGRLDVEPGGQIELSSPPGRTLAETIRQVHGDIALLGERAAECDAVLVGVGLDPLRPPRLLADHPRYLAMAEYFARSGDDGAAMMCSTASIQINVEAATASQSADDRWDLIQSIGPVMVAAFANSPHERGRATGWKSTRQAIWGKLDPARTGTQPRRPGEGIRSAYARWALDAPVMMFRHEPGDWRVPHGLTFRDWLRTSNDTAPTQTGPTIDDLAYHLTTLFPYVRARGHLETRFIDALPGCWWIVPTALMAALLNSPSTADRARDVCSATEGRWERAAREGVADGDLQRAAQGLLGLGADALDQDPTTTFLAEHLNAYREVDGAWPVTG